MTAYSRFVLVAPYFYHIMVSDRTGYSRMKKQRHENIYCPECEKVNKKIRLVRDECPECHYQHLIIKG